MAQRPKAKIGIVWRGAAESRGEPVPESSRLRPVFLALEAQGIAAEPAVYCEESSGEVRDQLLACDGVLVWVDPITDGRDRADLDAVMREVAAAGVWVSAHPDVIRKMGTKEVLFQTRHLGWGGDTALYRSLVEFRHEFPARLWASGHRVLKQYRGNGGQGVWKVTLLAIAAAPDAGAMVRLQEATHRDGTASELRLGDFMDRCEAYFSGTGGIIDQAFQPRIVEGMVRCYMSGNELVGFARQYPKGYGEGVTADDTFGLPAAKTMYSALEPQFQALRAKLEREWTPQMQHVLGLADASLPAIWDVDFLFGPRSRSGEDSFVLCEINASCITPIPKEAPAKIAETVVRALSSRLRAQLSTSP